jgi:hypothetical protein
MQLGFIGKLSLLVIAGLIGLIIGAIFAILLTSLLEKQHDRNSPHAEAGSMGGVAWLGVGLVLIFIFSPVMSAITIYITTLYL